MTNIISWFLAVAFAFVTNKLFVFKQRKTKVFREIISFVFARIGTLILDMGIMFLGVTVLNYNDKVVKLVVQVVVTLGNYFLSKFLVFKKTVNDEE